VILCPKVFYVTPTSYLELISTFMLLLKQQRTVVHQAKWRYDVGIEKIEEAASSVAALQKDLEDLQPVRKQLALSPHCGRIWKIWSP
jgi:hypothetical protein